jgi:hypothetical protein
LANGRSLLIGLALLAVTPTAFAQDAASLAKTLGQGVRCLDDRASGDLSEAVARVGNVDPVVVLDALTALSVDTATCQPVRTAAVALITERTALSNEVNVQDAARAVVDATLAEAELRAASMKFEVGPPPLNLSRGRSGGS